MTEQWLSIERDDHVLRTRRTAAITRMTLGIAGIALILGQPSLLTHPALGVAGFAAIALTSVIQLSARLSWLRIEESLSAGAAILIIGFGGQEVTVLSLLWLVALGAGVMARGGRVHWLGRTIVVAALAMPIVLDGSLSSDYAAFCLAVIGLQLTSGRLTLELSRLLNQARIDAENAETLLLAGDIAARVAQSAELSPPAARPATPGPRSSMTVAEEESARSALASLIAGEGLVMAAQPIVDLGTDSIHAYEALARFGRRRSDCSPLSWFALADELGERVALERACLKATLDLFGKRPAGTRLSVNLSVASLLDQPTLDLLDTTGASLRNDLEGLIIEITEETLVSSPREVGASLAALRRRGARLAVDDIGAGYSGLRQITTVLPDYLKLDRSLIAGIHRDGDRGALVRALSGYAKQVGSLLVAEGIEQRAELERLRELDVPLAQGFYLGAPGQPWPEGPSGTAPAPAGARRLVHSS